MKIQIITSCTGEKAVDHEHKLVLSDFQAGAKNVQDRESELKSLLTSAAEIYTGQQHIRLMKGVNGIQVNSKINLSLYILSAGYGLISSERYLAPYEVTFATMNKKDLEEWATFLNVPSDFRRVVAEQYDFRLILLGENYLQACDINDSIEFGGPTILLCGSAVAKKLPVLPNLKVIQLSNNEAKRFSCGLVGLKGEIAKRILNRIDKAGYKFIAKIMDSSLPLDLLDESNGKDELFKEVPNYTNSEVISIQSSWFESSHRDKLKYFIPEWDDLVDPNYDFQNDLHSGGTGNWHNQVYAHQIYPSPNYDGILISRVVVDESKKRRELMEALGVHGSLRVPDNFTVMGDCGAFGYIMEDVPPYSTENVLDYYTRYGFNLGVSVDHLIVGATMESAKERYQLTIHNAEDFLKEHKKLDLLWRPIGAVQGWDAKSYAAAAENYVKMGYDYIALGGLVRTKTEEVLRIVEEVSKVVPKNVDIHLFGLARLEGMRAFANLGITSVDSASHLRRAWLGANDNYWTIGGKRYAAIRIPQPSKKLLTKNSGVSAEIILKMEAACLNSVRLYDKGLMNLTDTLDILEEYDQVAMENRKSLRSHYERTLTDKPWKQCPCEICKKDGVEVIIFRGNNRNRRRGFHNTYVFYSLLKTTLTDSTFFIDESHRLFESEKVYLQNQLELFKSY